MMRNILQLKIKLLVKTIGFLLLLSFGLFSQVFGQTIINYGATTNASTIPVNNTVTINAGGTLNMDIDRTFSRIYTGTNGIATISGSYNLIVTNNISFADPGSNKTTTLNITNTGNISCQAFDYSSSTGQTRTFQTNLNNGTLTVLDSTPFPTAIYNGVISYSFDATNTTVNYTGATQTVLSVNYHNLTLSGSGTKTLQTGTTSIGGNFIVDNVTTTAVAGLTIGGDVILERAFSFTGGAFTHNVAGNWTKNGWGTFTSTGGTINFTGLSSTINGTHNDVQTFNNIIVSKTVGQTLSVGGSLTTLNINGNLTLTSGAFAPGTKPTVLSGNWTNNGGNLTSGTGTVTMNGVSKTIGGTNSTTFINLTIGNNARIFLANSQTVNGTLTLANGTLALTSHNLTLGPLSSIASSGFYSTNMIVADGSGELRKIFTGNGSYTFPIGDVTSGNNYSPVTLNFTGGTYAPGAYVAVRVTDAKHPNNASILTHIAAKNLQFT